MHRNLIATSIVALTLGTSSFAHANAQRWDGWYIGAHFGGGSEMSRNANPEGSAIFGDKGTSSLTTAGVQGGYNWQALGGRSVFGIEGALAAMKSRVSYTCLAVQPAILSANCTQDHDAFASLTGRIGYVVGDQMQSLIFARAGAAWLRSTVSIASGGGFPTAPEVSRGINSGWTVGAGLEHALGPQWSFVASYDYAHFASGDVATPMRLQQNFPGFPSYDLYPGTRTSHDFALHMFRLGLNYRIGAERGADEFAPLVARGQRAQSAWQVEIGARYWMSNGRFQKDLGAYTDATRRNELISRLTYDSAGHSGEIFARIDAPAGYFLKGYAGAGKLGSGKMIDEDWLLDSGTPYSATHSRVDGSIAYASIDAGYTVSDSNGIRLGAFVGYHFLRDKKLASGCVQFGYPVAAPCGDPMSYSTPVISEDDDWHSLRIGAVADIRLTDKLTFTADAAWIPYARFKGVDGHLQRTDVANKFSDQFGTGQGVQLEALLSLEVMPRLRVGVGGRYWNMWSENSVAEAFGTKCPNCQTLPIRSERYGLFFQTSYAFGDDPRMN